MKAIFVTTVRLIIIITIFSLETVVASNQVRSDQDISSNTNYIVLGMGCFWGAEKRMGEIPGVIDVESGYAGGDLPGIGYQQILNHEKALRAGKAVGRNHAEVIKVNFNPEKVTLETVLARF